MRNSILIVMVAWLTACGGSDGGNGDLLDGLVPDGGGDVSGDTGGGPDGTDGGGGDDTTPGDDTASGDADTAGGDDTAAGDTGSGDTVEGDTALGDTAPGDTAEGDTALGDTGPGDTATGDTGTGDTGTGDTGTGDTGTGDDGGGEVIIPPCDPSVGDPCEQPGARRCAPDTPGLVDECDSVEGCLAWVSTFACDVNLCTNDVDECVDGECVPTGPSNVNCPPSDEPCLENACDPTTGACALKPAAEGTPCSDGLACTANDGCFDGFCIGDPECPKPCVQTEITCGTALDLTLTSGGTKVMDSYACDGLEDGANDGWERTFLVANANAFDCPDMRVTAELDDPAKYGVQHVDLALLGIAQGICNPDQCELGGVMGAAGEGELTRTLAAKEKVILVADGRDGYAGTVRVTASCCGLLVEGYCGDGVDDDFDGQTDCDDLDCQSSTVCNYEHLCDNGADDDGDNKQDCADPDCAASPACATETACDDGVDNEEDGKTDCEDDDCLGAPGCGAACPGAVELTCGATLTGQGVGLGSSQFSGDAWPPCGESAGSITYNNAHAVYAFSTDTGCATATVDSGLGAFDFYLGAGSCEASSCVDGGYEILGENTATATGIAAGWLAVFIEDSSWSALQSLTFDVSLDCTCP